MVFGPAVFAPQSLINSSDRQGGVMKTSELTQGLMIEGCNGCKCLHRHLVLMEQRLEQMVSAASDLERYPSGIDRQANPIANQVPQPGNAGCGIGDYS